MKNVSLDECKGKTDKAKRKGVVSLSSFNRLLLTQDPGKKDPPGRHRTVLVVCIRIAKGR